MSSVVYQTFKVTFATLYPAYASYKAVKTKNVKDYVKWMMYWVVYAFFVSVEVVADIFIVWIPFYYEMKILFMLWLLSPTTKGSSILYRKFVHPQLNRRESEIDTYIDHATEQGYSTFLTVGARVLTFLTNLILSSAAKGQSTLVEHLSRSGYGVALQDDGDGDIDDDADDITDTDKTDKVEHEHDDPDSPDETPRRRRRGRGRTSGCQDADESASEILRTSHKRQVSAAGDDVKAAS